jgi:hypothetical protein
MIGQAIKVEFQCPNIEHSVLEEEVLQKLLLVTWGEKENQEIRDHKPCIQRFKKSLMIDLSTLLHGYLHV